MSKRRTPGLAARIGRAFVSNFAMWRQTGIRSTWQWTGFRLKCCLGMAEPATLKLWPRQTRFPLTVRLRGSSDMPVFREIFVEEPFSSLRELGNPSFVVDLGANAGYSSAYFLNCFPNARLVAVEPDPRNAEICRLNLAPYGERVRILQGAIWSECTELSLLTQSSETKGRECATQVTEDGTGSQEKVPAWDMETLMQMVHCSEIDLLKIDIEGAERAVFCDRAQSWLERVRNLCIELHGDGCNEAVFGQLSRFTYDLEQAGDVVICRNLRSRKRTE